MCCFSIDYPKPKDELVEQLTNAIKVQKEGFFVGDTSSGRFSFLAKGFTLAGSYEIEADRVKVSILKKPWLLSCKKIEAEIIKYLG
jgi:hypothetical protein